MRRLVHLAFLALALSPGAVTADAGPELAVRGGWGVTSDHALVDRFVPIWAELGYRLDSRVILSAYVEYGFGRARNFLGLCPSGGGADCSGGVFRVGGEVLLHPWPEARLSPWAAVGAGWARYSATASASVPAAGTAGQTTITVVAPSATQRGYEAALQLGADVRLGSGLSAGPYAAYFTGAGGAFEGGLRLSYAL
jgi:hypothetical protein